MESGRSARLGSGLRRNRRKRSLRRAQRVSEQETGEAAASGPDAYLRTGTALLGPDQLKGQSSAQKTPTLSRHKALVLTCVKIRMCSLLGFDLHTISAHSCAGASRAAQSVRAISAQLRKVPRAPAGDRLAGRNIRAEAQGRTSVPPAEAEEERTDALRSSPERESAQRATLARPAGHPPNFGRL